MPVSFRRRSKKSQRCDDADNRHCDSELRRDYKKRSLLPESNGSQTVFQRLGKFDGGGNVFCFSVETDLYSAIAL